ncbi:uncharacterized protein RHO25_003478 [Cercospora beticola]|nr:hypothetical protein RHO25_003478 [Cercospora beticola]
MDYQKSRSPIRLDELPDLILRNICHQLGDCRQFAVVSRNCLDPARASIFATISIKASIAIGVHHQLAEWKKRLQQLQCLAHVRTLRLQTGYERPVEAFDDYGDHLNKQWRHRADVYSHLRGLSDERADWQDLIEFIAQLPGLKDFVYAGGVPICIELFQALEGRRCRLHMKTFCLSSLLYYPHEQEHTIERTELQMATSPQLYGVKLNEYDELGNYGHFDFRLEGLLDMAKGLAPGLREVSVKRDKPSDSSDLKQLRTKARRQWQGTELGTLPSWSKGSLSVLELAGKGSTTLEALQVWHGVTDFSKLQELKLHGPVKSETVTWMLECCNLNSLRHLVLHLETRDPECKAALELFESIRPLKELKLVAHIDQKLLLAVLKRHGPTLQSLIIVPSVESRVSCEMLADLIADHCPVLEKLTMPMRRSQGDAKEVAMYQRFRRLTCLEELYLVLRCDGEDSHDITDRNTTIKKVLIDHGIDPALATSIFKVITNADITPTAPLRRLEIRPESAQLAKVDLGCSRDEDEVFIETEIIHGLGDVCHTIAGHWVCLKDAWNGTLYVESAGDEEMSIDAIRGEVGAAFYELWPMPKKYKKYWSENWTSFPLET